MKAYAPSRHPERDEHDYELNFLQPDKNLHASVPPSLLSQAEKAAQEENITLDELVRGAMERRLNRGELDALFAFGKRHARQRGLKPRDVAAAIDAVRSAGKERGR